MCCLIWMILFFSEHFFSSLNGDLDFHLKQSHFRRKFSSSLDQDIVALCGKRPSRRRRRCRMHVQEKSLENLFSSSYPILFRSPHTNTHTHAPTTARYLYSRNKSTMNFKYPFIIISPSTRGAGCSDFGPQPQHNNKTLHTDSRARVEPKDFFSLSLSPTHNLWFFTSPLTNFKF